MALCLLQGETPFAALTRISQGNYAALFEAVASATTLAVVARKLSSSIDAIIDSLAHADSAVLELFNEHLTLLFTMVEDLTSPYAVSIAKKARSPTAKRLAQRFRPPPEHEGGEGGGEEDDEEEEGDAPHVLIFGKAPQHIQGAANKRSVVGQDVTAMEERKRREQLALKALQEARATRVPRSAATVATARAAAAAAEEAGSDNDVSEAGAKSKRKSKPKKKFSVGDLIWAKDENYHTKWPARVSNVEHVCREKGLSLERIMANKMDDDDVFVEYFPLTEPEFIGYVRCDDTWNYGNKTKREKEMIESFRRLTRSHRDSEKADGAILAIHKAKSKRDRCGSGDLVAMFAGSQK